MRFLTLTLAAMALTFSALAQPVCAPLWMTFDLATEPGSTPEEVYFWVTPLNGLAVISADGVVDVPAGGTLTTETQVCLNAGCYFVGLETAADWWPSVDVVTDDLMWSVSEPEPMYEQNDLVGFTFCVENNFADCEVELDAELGVGPNGAYLFQAETDAEGAIFTWSVNGSILAEGPESEWEWYDMLGAPWWEVCVMMVTPEGCGAMDCMNPSDFEVGGCIDESLIDPNMACTEEWDPVCGCDGVTYSNACYATFYGGVTQYTPGECGSTGGCEPIIEAWPSDVPGVWNFQVYDVSNPAGGPLSGDDLEWQGNGQVVGEDGPNGATQVAFWGTNDFLFVMCVSVMCEDEIVEVCWENPNEGQTEGNCENVVIALNAEWGSAAGVDPLELELVLSMMDVELDLDLSQILEGGSFNETLAFCLPVGFCYELEAAIGNLNALNVDLFEIAAGVGQELPAWQDVLAALTGPDASWSVSLGVDVLEGCDDESGIAQVSETWGVRSYPNPTSGDLTVEAPQGTAMLLRNALGQVVDAWTQSGSRELRFWGELPAGSYVLEAAHDGARRKVNVLILR
jgi:hypothetical protein